MRELVEQIGREWGTLSSAPITFVLTLLLAFAAAFFVAQWGHERIASSLREQVNTLRERLIAKDELLTSYRSRLEIAEESRQATGSALSKLSNAELQTRTLALVQQLRQFIATRKALDYRHSDERMQQMRTAQSDEERSRLWHEAKLKSSQESVATGSEFDTKYRVEAILLRDELLTRVPASVRAAREQRTDSTYEHPTNYFGYTDVADDLEKLAKTL